MSGRRRRSRASDDATECCSWWCCFKFIVSSSVGPLFTWLIIKGHPSVPTCSIDDFYVPALNKTANSTADTTIYFDLLLETMDEAHIGWGIYYDDLILTFYYAPNLSSPIANLTFPKFYVGDGKDARLNQTVETRGVPWDDVRRRVFNGSTAVFRVHLATSVRVKIVYTTSKRRHLRLGANLKVSDTGKMPGKKKRIRLY